jgi:hypothetical protein
MGVSTLTIYQHHAIDVVTAFSLVGVTFFIFPAPVKRNCRIAMIYFFVATLLALMVLFLYDKSFIAVFFITWLIIALLKVGKAYLNTNARFLKRNDGTISPMNKIICLPYILTCKIIRRLFCKNENILTEVFPNFYIGAAPDSRTVQSINMDKRIKVIDLTAEVEERKIIRTISDYYSCPMLDIASWNESETAAILDLITKIYASLDTGEKIFVHCLMGYSRSMYIATMFLKKQSNLSP